MNDPIDANLQDCTAVIAAFGGIRPMAQKLGVPVSTVQGWKQRNAIPENRIGDILSAAETHNVDLAGVVGTAEPDEAPSAAISKTPPESSPLSQKRSEKRTSSNRGALLVAVIALIVAIGAIGVGGWLVLAERVPTIVTSPGADFTGITDRLNALETAARSDGADDMAGRQFLDEIAELRAEIGRVAEAKTGNATPVEEIDELSRRLQAAESEIDQIQARAASAARAAKAASSAAQGEIEKLREQLAALGENRLGGGQNITGAVGLALAAGRLQRALDNGDTYEDVLASLRALSAGDAGVGAILDRLAARAASGVPTRAALTQSFPGTARAVAAAANTDAASGWVDRTLQRIRNTVSIRRIGADVPGDTPGAKVARAEAKLNRGNLGSAIAELDGLTGAAASVSATWRDAARARHDAEVAAGDLEALAIARLQAGSGGS